MARVITGPPSATGASRPGLGQGGPLPCIPIPVTGEPKKNACEMASHSVLATMPATLI